MYELHHGRWGMIPGDGYKLIATTVVSKHETREAAWEAFFAVPLRDQHEYLVKKPVMNNNSQGWPSRWDDRPNENH